MPAVAVLLLVRPESVSELPRSALSVAHQSLSDWELRIVHGGEADLAAAAADLSAADPRIAGAADIAGALANSSAPLVCWLESGARFPVDYLAGVAQAMADSAVRATVAARSVEHGPRFAQTDRIPPSAPEPTRSQIAVRRADAQRPVGEVLSGEGRCDLPDVVVATRFGEPVDPRAWARLTVVVELSDTSPPLSVKPQLAELAAAGFPIVLSAAGPARLVGRLALGGWLREHRVPVAAAARPAAARSAALEQVTTPLVAFLPAGWEIEPRALTDLAELLAGRDAAAVAPVARDGGGCILGAGLLWADERTLPQRLMRGHPFSDIDGRLVAVPAPHPEGLVVRTEDMVAGGRDAGEIPAPWWPAVVLARSGRSGPVLIDARHDIAIPRFTPASAAQRSQLLPRPPSPEQRREIARSAPPGAVSASAAALAECGWSVVGVAPDAADLWRAVVARPAARTEPVMTRRWALKIGAPPGRRGDSWGDVFFADDLASALRSLGNDVVVDRDGSGGRSAAYLDRVVLNLRGYQVVPRQPGTAHLLWIISHPDLVSPEEMREYDRVYAASASWPAAVRKEHGIDVRPLLQATDPARFHPDVAPPDTGPELLFVGNSKDQHRPIIADCRTAGLRPTVIGRGWEKFLPSEEIAALEIPNSALPAAYRSAGIVLNDHWGDMAGYGFLNNRLFDAVACGSRVVTDEVQGLSDIFGSAVQIYRSPEDLARLCSPGNRGDFGTEEDRREQARRIAAEHSFTARAQRLMADAIPIPVLSD